MLLVCLQHYHTLHFDFTHRSSLPSRLVHSTKQNGKFTYKVWPDKDSAVACVAVGDTKRQLLNSSSSTAWLTYKGQCFKTQCSWACCGPSSLCWLSILVLLFYLILHCRFGFLILGLASSHHSTLLGRSLSIMMYSQQNWIIEEKGELRNYFHSLSRKW